MERDISFILGDIFRDVDNFVEEKQAEEESRRKFAEKSEALHTQVMDILRTRGEPHKTSMGTGAGPGIIGYRYETASYLATPPVEVKIGDQKIQICLIENLSSGPNHSIRHSGVSIEKASSADQKDKTVLFKIGGKVINWRGEEGTPTQMDMAEEILNFVSESLPELPVSARLPAHLQELLRDVEVVEP